MKLVHVSALLAVVGAAVAFVPGCGGNSALDQDPKTELLKTEQAIRSPSGVISKSTMPNVFAKATQQSMATSAVSLTGISSSSGTSSPASRPAGGNPLSCLSGDETQGSFDVSCLDAGLTGSIEFKADIEGASIYEMVAIEDVCTTATSECIDGFMATGITTSPQKIESFMDVTLTGPISGQFQFGAEESTSGVDASAKVVVFDDNGDSYVLDAEVDGDSGGITVSGSNGTWSCTYSDSGSSGGCTEMSGTHSGTFNWS